MCFPAQGRGGGTVYTPSRGGATWAGGMSMAVGIIWWYRTGDGRFGPHLCEVLSNVGLPVGCSPLRPGVTHLGRSLYHGDGHSQDLLI